MGLASWLRDIFGVTKTHVVEEKRIEMPEDGELILFQFQKGTPKHVMREFDQRLVEFQNKQQKFVTTDMKIVIRKAKKSQLKTEEANESNQVQGHPEGPG